MMSPSATVGAGVQADLLVRLCRGGLVGAFVAQLLGQPTLALIAVAGSSFLLGAVEPAALLGPLLAMTLLDVNFGNLARVPGLTWKEIALPMAAWGYLAAGAVHRRLGRGLRSSPWPLRVMAVLCFLVLVHYVRNPVTAGNLFGASSGQQGGLRTYWLFFVDLAWVLLGPAIVNARTVKQLPNWLLGLALATILSAGWMAATGEPLPWIGSAARLHHYELITKYQRVKMARVGGEMFGALLLLLILARYERKRMPLRGWLLCSVAVLMLWVSGGRAGMVGVLVAGSTYLFLVNPRAFITRGALLAALFVFLFLWLTAVPRLPGQRDRFFDVKTLMRTGGNGRFPIWQMYWRGFKQSPWIGHGLAMVEIGDNIRWGNYSHGTYGAVLFSFGLVGMACLLALFAYGLSTTWRLRQATKSESDPDAASIREMATFSFLWFVYLLVVYVAGGSGINDVFFYALVGIVNGLEAYAGAHFPGLWGKDMDQSGTFVP